jgi:hypothetical protein
MRKIFIIPVIFFASCGEGEVQAVPEPQIIRPPAVAGAFYPADSATLSALIDSLMMSRSGGWDESSSVVSCVVPHAGYVYSGGVAAYLYDRIENEDYDLVFLVGPSHHVAFEGFSVFDGDLYVTPLGEVPVAREVCRRLISAHPQASFVPEAHSSEHCLEVQLPFIQRALPEGVRIVPVLTGTLLPDQIEFMAELILAEASSARILLLVSSDLSHYPSRRLAESTDQKTIDVFLDGDPEDFYSYLYMESLPGGVATAACGGTPMTLMLYYNSIYPDCGTRLLSHATSADAGGDTGSVVGYASLVSESPFTNPADWRLTSSDREILLSIARESVESAVLGLQYTLPDVSGSAGLILPRGAFVTLKKNGSLRGCIGSIRPVRELAETVASNARAAALEDPRFLPVSAAELDQLEYEISVLSPLQILEDWRDVRVGTDGLLIVSDYGSGLLLPQVPVELGWDGEEFMEGLCRKAGLSSDAYLGDVVLYRFTAEVFDGHGTEETGE